MQKIFDIVLRTALSFGSRFALRHAYRSLHLRNMAAKAGNEQRGFLFAGTSPSLNPVINTIYPDFFQARLAGLTDFKPYGSTNPVNNSLAIAQTADFVAILTTIENTPKEHDDFITFLEENGINQKKLHFSVFNPESNSLRFAHTHKNDSPWLTKRLGVFDHTSISNDNRTKKEAVIACIDKRKNNMLFSVFPSADIIRSPGASIQKPGDCRHMDAAIAKLKDYENIHLIIHTDCVAVKQTMHGHMKDNVILSAIKCCTDHSCPDKVTKKTVQFSLDNLKAHGISLDKVNIMMHDVESQNLMIYNNNTGEFLNVVDQLTGVNNVTLEALPRIYHYNIQAEEEIKKLEKKK